VRAGMVGRAEEYRWSSAAAHLGDGRDGASVLDGGFWERSGGGATWREMHAAGEQEDRVHLLRRCAYAGRPFGEESFVVQMEEHFRRQWRRWSFQKAAGSARI
jgi:putative transposase